MGPSCIPLWDLLLKWGSPTPPAIPLEFAGTGTVQHARVPLPKWAILGPNTNWATVAWMQCHAQISVSILGWMQCHAQVLVTNWTTVGWERCHAQVPCSTGAVLKWMQCHAQVPVPKWTPPGATLKISPMSLPIPGAPLDVPAAPTRHHS